MLQNKHQVRKITLKNKKHSSINKNFTKYELTYKLKNFFTFTLLTKLPHVNSIKSSSSFDFMFTLITLLKYYLAQPKFLNLFCCYQSRVVNGPTSSGPNPARTRARPEKPGPIYNSVSELKQGLK